MNKIILAILFTCLVSTEAKAADETKSDVKLAFETQAKRVCIEYPSYDSLTIRPYIQGNLGLNIPIFTKIKCNRIRSARNKGTFVLGVGFNHRLSKAVKAVAEESPNTKIVGSSHDGLIDYSINALTE